MRTDTDSVVAAQIQNWRDALIDLSRRNPLLSLPKTVIPLATTPDQIWKLPPAGKRGVYRFVPRSASQDSPEEGEDTADSDSAHNTGQDASYHLNVDGTPEAREDVYDGAAGSSSEHRSATARPVVTRADQMRAQFADDGELKRLNNLRLKSRLSLSEQGVNVLFVTLGTLEWQDPRIGALRSPILLLPVELERDPHGAGFVLARFEDDIKVNPTLLYRLAQPDIKLELPDWDEDDITTNGVATLLQVVADLGRKRDGWKVITDECLLGRFSYLRLAMYEDLLRQEEAARTRPIIRALAGDVAALANLPSVAVRERRELDGVTPQSIYHVLPADPSQQQAVLAARAGQSFVLQGPPGTGKTQTIANIIAACIADGRKVLFVSEKMAALDAVYKRLEHARLGTFCLQAHSHKANKFDIIEQLKKAYHHAGERQVAGGDPPPYELIESLRRELDEHVDALHLPRYPLGISIYDARGVLASIADASSLPFVLATPEATSQADYRAKEVLAERLAGYHDLFERAEDHPWSALQPVRFSAEFQARLRAVLGDLLQNADGAPVTYNELRVHCGLTPVEEDGVKPNHVGGVGTIAKLLEETPRPERAWLESPSAEVAELLTAARRMQRRFQTYLTRREKLLERWGPGILDLPHVEVEERLTARHEGPLRPAIGPTYSDLPGEQYVNLSDLLGRIADRVVALRLSADRLCAVCGLTAAKTMSQLRYTRSVVRAALEDFRPSVAWFAGGGLARVRELVGTARGKQKIVVDVDGVLNSVYNPDTLAALDLDGLHSRFLAEYAGQMRFLKRTYWADRKALTQALKPGVRFTSRSSISGDLVLACERRDASQWLELNGPMMTELLGAYYGGFGTDWATVDQALQRAEVLLMTLGGPAPSALQSKLVAGGLDKEELRDQFNLFDERLKSYQNVLDELLQTANRTRIPPVALPRSDELPLAQLPIETLREWCIMVAPALNDINGAREELRRLRRGWPARAVELVADLREGSWLVSEGLEISLQNESLRARYASFFDGLDTRWESLFAALDWTQRLQQAFAAAEETLTPDTILIATSANKDLVFSIAQARGKSELLERRQAEAWIEALKLFRPEMLRSGDGSALLEAAEYSEQREFAEARMASLGQLERWLSFQQLRLECSDAGMLSFYEVITRRNVASNDVVPAFRRGFHERWLDALIAETPALHSFTGAIQDGRRRKLSDLERSLIASNPARIHDLTRDRRNLTASANVGEVAALRRLLNMKKPRASVRTILGEIPNLLFRLTPCLMMSPLSVSLFVDPNRISFNLVIFDEASQVLVESALGALLRGDQVIIAGDTQQLPPTSFFKGMQDGDGDGDDDGVADGGDAERASSQLGRIPETPDGMPAAGSLLPHGAAGAHEFASVLAAAASVATDPDRFPERELTWHYRSRHESLISFSRRRFYHSLDTFPAAARPSALAFEYVQTGVYHGGAGKPRNNPIEARRVVDLVIDQLRAEPGSTVGVITMSEAQQNCVLAELDRRRSTLLADPDLVALLGEDALPERQEPLFVKNIENVQGDERDVIFLSIGYGKYPDGKMHQRFGPINNDGGEKRLNVAVTRARESCVTVSSIQPEEIVIREDTRTGPRLLREYMEEARAARHVPIVAVRDSRDQIASAIADALTERGHTVHLSVGMFAYTVDLAVVDPKNPDAYVLGIECDGHNYASGETAYSRDVLRAQVLQTLGWRLVHVWSAEWIRDSDAVLTRLEAALTRTDEVDAGIDDERNIQSDLSSDRKEMGDASPGLQASSGDGRPPDSVTPSVAPQHSGTVRYGALLPGMTYYEPATVAPLRGGGDSLYGYGSGETAARRRFVEDLVFAEGPISEAVLPTLLARSGGLNRAGKIIQDGAHRVVDELVANGVVRRVREGDLIFLWPASMQEAPGRIPKPGDTTRPIDQVSRAEIGQVVIALLRSAVGMRRDEAIVETARIMGYDRLGTNVREKIEATLSQLEFDHQIHVRGGQVYTFAEP